MGLLVSIRRKGKKGLSLLKVGVDCVIDMHVSYFPTESIYLSSRTDISRPHVAKSASNTVASYYNRSNE
jgi:hypothetical protein